MDMLIFADKNKYPLNYRFLHTSYHKGNLVGAEIFAELFKLNDTCFKKQDMITDKDGFISICSFLNIKSNEWNILLNFIKFGKIIEYYGINVLLELSNKFGGIPSIDKYYNDNFINIKKPYNPQTSEEDIKLLYEWKIGFASFQKTEYNDYEFTKLARDNYAIFRKLKVT